MSSPQLSSSINHSTYRQLIEQERRQLNLLRSALVHVPWPFQLEKRVMVERDLRIFDQLLSLATSGRGAEII